MEGAGYVVEVMGRSAAFIVRKPRIRVTLRLMYEYGLKSLPVVMTVALFSGMILALQTGIQMAKLGQEQYIGVIVALTFAREFGPFMTCIVLVGTVVSAYAAELGTMTVSEETSALEVMSIEPIGFLAAPRIFALTVMTFLLTFCAVIIGLVGGAIVAHSQLGVAYDRFFDLALDSLSGREWLGLPRDLYSGLLKATLTGYVIAAVGCAQGLRAQGGAMGVGTAVRRAVITSIVLILIISYDFTWLVYRAFET
ncbi:MAG: ABC transporter permease [Planctomycetes bacterium]|nr:ABC transporter permease [Planctomycetota bacterium]